MSAAKHTPGPWEVTFNGLIVSSTSRETVAAPLYGGSKPIKRMDADADLIAAAPEMAEALRRMLDVYGKDVTSGASDQARAALAKAGL